MLVANWTPLIQIWYILACRTDSTMAMLTRNSRYVGIPISTEEGGRRRKRKKRSKCRIRRGLDGGEEEVKVRCRGQD